MPDGSLSVFKTADLSKKKRYTLSPRPTALALRPAQASKKSPPFIVGTHTGDVVMRDVVLTLDQQVNSVDYAVDIAAAVSESQLAIIDPIKAVVLARHTIRHASPLTHVTILSSSHAIVASQLLSLVELSSGAILRNYTGHTTSVSSAALLPDDKLITASSDKFLSVWDTTMESATPSRKRRRKATFSSAVHTLIAPAPVSSVAVSSMDGVTVAAVCNSAGVAVWRDYQVEDNPTPASFVVRLPGNAPADSLFDATFIKTGRLCIVYGNTHSPSIYSTRTDHEADQELPSFTSNVLMDDAVIKPMRKEQAKLDLIENVATAHVAASSTKPVRRKANGTLTSEEEGVEEKAERIEEELQLEPTLEEKLANLGIRRDANSGKSAVLEDDLLSGRRLDSRVSIMLQAIRSKDPTLFDTCVESVSNMRAIQETVDLIPAGIASEDLISMLVKRLQMAPRRADKLIPWIRAVLMEHASALISQPKNDALVELLGIIEARTRSLEALSRLEGRLELVMGQVRRLRKSQRAKAEVGVPDAEYTEKGNTVESEKEEEVVADEMEGVKDDEEDMEDSDGEEEDSDSEEGESSDGEEEMEGDGSGEASVEEWKRKVAVVAKVKRRRAAMRRKVLS